MTKRQKKRVRVRNQENRQFNLFLVCLICLFSVASLFGCGHIVQDNNSDHIEVAEPKGEFSNNPSWFNVDSLAVYKEVFRNLQLRADSVDGVSILEVKSSDCQIIPFCGYLKKYNNTIFFSPKKYEKGVPFLFLDAPRLKKWSITYSSLRSDSVTYMGQMYDKIYNDSVMFFLLKPYIAKGTFETEHLRYITYKGGRIRYLTFRSSGGKDITISLVKYPKVIYQHD